MWQHHVLTFICCEIPDCLKINIDSTLDRYKLFIMHQDQNNTWISPGPRCLGGPSYTGTGLVQGFVSNSPGLEQMHRLNRV